MGELAGASPSFLKLFPTFENPLACFLTRHACPLNLTAYCHRKRKNLGMNYIFNNILCKTECLGIHTKHMFGYAYFMGNLGPTRRVAALSVCPSEAPVA